MDADDTVVDRLLRLGSVFCVILFFAVMTRKCGTRLPDLEPPPAPAAASQRIQKGPPCLRETSCLIEGLACAGTDRICRNHLWQSIECAEGLSCGDGATCTDARHRTLACRASRLTPPVVEARQGTMH